MKDYEFNVDPEGRLRCYGIYSAVVTSIADPLKKNRIQVQVPTLTSVESTNWAKPCLPITANSYHPDHLPHTAAQVAALLTTTPATLTSSSAGTPAHTHTTTVPALTVVPKAGAGQLNHPHAATQNMLSLTPGSKNSWVADGIIQSSVDSSESSTYANGITAPDGTTTPEHTFHRAVPRVGQQVWVMFEGGDPDLPVWIGVQS
jgi:hypothetical protein